MAICGGIRVGPFPQRLESLYPFDIEVSDPLVTHVTLHVITSWIYCGSLRPFILTQVYLWCVGRGGVPFRKINKS